MVGLRRGRVLQSQDIFIEPFPPTGARHRISQEGGNLPLWAPDGSGLFYRRVAVRGFSTLQSVEISTTVDFAFGNEQTLPLRFLVFSTYRDYDITPDGQHFVVVVPATEDEEAPRDRIEVVLNAFEELKARVPN